MKSYKNFDIAFIDVTAPKAYDTLSLEYEAMGGTEATVVRVAEALGRFGLNVAVFQKNIERPLAGNNCLYMPLEELPKYSYHATVHLRGVSTLEVVESNKKFVWLHDVASEKITNWQPTLLSNKATIVGVSKWHKANIEPYAEGVSVTYIYNPVQDSIYLKKSDRMQHDPSLMCWMASPHKGLAQALEMFREVRRNNPEMRLLVFNPGYLQAKLAQQPGVMYYGATQCRDMWQIMQRALCVFYPTNFEETFGLIAAEANALGVPVATNAVAALNETVSTKEQLVQPGDKDAMLALIERWKAKRPTVSGQDRFRLSVVVKEWLKLLNES